MYATNRAGTCGAREKIQEERDPMWSSTSYQVSKALSGMTSEHTTKNMPWVLLGVFLKLGGTLFTWYSSNEFFN